MPVNSRFSIYAALAVLLATGLGAFGASPSAALPVLGLQSGWAIQSGCEVNASGEAVSSHSYRTQGWIAASVPATVLTAQIAAGRYRDVFRGTNFRNLPGMTYPIGLNSFAILPMEKNSPYACSWWYRTSFDTPRDFSGHAISLHFRGINYRANIWLNGQKVADAKDVAGAYRTYEFDVTKLLDPRRKNVLAVEVFAPTEKDLGINWVDWNPFPPDKSMGLWRDVYLTAAGPVVVRYPEVVTHFPGGSLAEADLTVVSELRNGSDKAVEGTLQAVIDDAPALEKHIALAPGEARTVTLSPEEFTALKQKSPALWWPVDMGPHTLHDLTVRFKIGGAVSDEQSTRFGIREITSELTPQGYRLFRVNGKRVLIRGAQWTQDMLLRRSPERLEAQMEYASALHINALRLEGQIENDDFFDQTDQRGILIMAGWCCCDIWEKWDQWGPDTLKIATESIRSQTLRLRSHPSMLVWLNGSDGPPPPSIEQAYLQVLKEVNWPNPALSSASAQVTAVSGPSGVKMTGPYDYEPPSYWYVDTKFGGAYGFNTETGPGPAIPPIESLKKMLPKDHLWPIDAVWNYHAGGERFQNVNRFNEAMNNTYGTPAGLEEYERKAQAMAYDGERALFEAYTARKYTSTGVIQFMLNNGWPSLIWHLFDYYLQPSGGYFGTKKGCEPLHVQYSYDDRSVVVANNTVNPVHGLTVSARVYDINLHESFSREAQVDAEADGVKSAFAVPPFPAEPATAVYFVKLSLRTADGNEVSSNFYWLPVKLSTLAWDKTPDTSFTPIAEFEDMTELNKLPRAELQATATLESGNEGQTVIVKLKNRSKSLAFQTRLAIAGGRQNEEILPVLWDDNYISLMPGESRTVCARYNNPTAVSRGAALLVDGWNVAPLKVALHAASRAPVHGSNIIAHKQDQGDSRGQR